MRVIINPADGSTWKLHTSTLQELLKKRAKGEEITRKTLEATPNCWLQGSVTLNPITLSTKEAAEILKKQEVEAKKEAAAKNKKRAKETKEQKIARLKKELTDLTK